MSAEAISGGSAPNEEPSESDLERSEYANEACDLLADAVGIGRRNCWVALESAEETDSDDCKGDAEAAWVSCVKGMKWVQVSYSARLGSTVLMVLRDGRQN